MVLADSLSDTQQWVDAGAPQLALQKLDQGNADLRNPDWQRQQWQILAKTGSDDEVLKRAALVPKDAPPEVQHTAALLAARAAINKGNGGLARGYLAQLLWVLPADTETYRELRKLVVQSHLLPQADAEAASAMLRYQQEFGVDNGLLHLYAIAMLQVGRDAEVKWARAQLAANDTMAALIDATDSSLSDTDIKQRMQAVLNSEIDAPMLLQLRKMATQMNAPELLIQINERLLNLATSVDGVAANDIWKAYRSLTQSFGNVRLLLFGSDAGWAELARESVATNPVMARAIWAYLARDAKDPALRNDAQQQLLDQLLALHLDRAALRLFIAAWPGLPVSTFNATVRYRLGQLALDAGEHKLAVNLWRNQDSVPDGVNFADWQVRRATLFARQAIWSATANAIAAWLGTGTVTASAANWQMLELTLQLSHQATLVETAQALLTRELAVAEPAQRRVLLQRLAQIVDAAQPIQAAQWYLQAAMQLPQPDYFAWQSRLDAAASLDQAGLHEDAKLQYQLVSKASTDAAQQAAANYALSIR